MVRHFYKLHPTSFHRHRFFTAFSDKQRRFTRGALPGGFSREALQQWAMNEWGNSNTRKRGQQQRRGELQQVHEHHLPYVDLFSQKISPECVDYLNDSDTDNQQKRRRHPSSELTECFFSSKHFLPERFVLTFLFSLFGSSLPQTQTSTPKPQSLTSTSNDTVTITTMPSSFVTGTKYLAWTVASQSPLEVICTWQFNFNSFNVKGCTMIAYDPLLRRVYHGNCFCTHSSSSSSFASGSSSPSSSPVFIEKNDQNEVEIENNDEETWSNFFLRTVVIPLHTRYARFLLSGMVKEVEQRAREDKLLRQVKE